jgi:hypothetical protein
MKEGCKLGIDSYADTSVAGKHAHVIEFIEGRQVTARSWNNNETHNLRIANVAYAYDSPNGQVLILIVNQSIYGGNDMNDSLLQPIQCLNNGVRVNTNPSCHFEDDPTAQTISINDTVLPIEFNGPLPFIQVRRPTQSEFDQCTHFELTSHDEWDPYTSSQALKMINTQDTPQDPTSQIYNPISETCAISSELMNNNYFSVLDNSRELLLDTSSQDTFSYRSLSSMKTSKNDTLSPEALAKLWGIGLKTARKTLLATEHKCIRTVGDLTRRFRTDKAHMRYKKLSTKHGRFYVDTLKSKVKSIRGFTCGNLYTNSLGFRKFFPMITESHTPSTLQSFITLVGLPPKIHADNAKVFTSGDFEKKCKKYDIGLSYTEPHSPWMNRAETGIRSIKSFGRKIMAETQAPIRLWCFAYEYAAEIQCLLATGVYELDGRTPYEHVMQYTPDISEYVIFKWYQWAYYWDEIDKEKRLCRWLGTASQVGQAMCFYILIDSGKFIARSTVIPIPEQDLNDSALQEQMKNFTSSIHSHIGDHRKALVKAESQVNEDEIYHDAFFDSTEDDDITWPWETELEDIPLAEQDSTTLETLDEYIGSHIVLPGIDGEQVLTEIKGRKRDHNGQLIGSSNPNPILDTRIYNVEFPDGHLEAYSTNKIAEALYSQVDQDGFNTGLLQEICDHKKSSSAIPIENGYVLSGSTKKPVVTTKGWKLKIQWQDGSFDWLPLSQLKESNPIEVAEYAFAHNINNEPAFNWWVTSVLRKRDRLINKINTTPIRKYNMKFGVDVPTTFDEAMELDKYNGNTLWRDAIEKEMKVVDVAFKFLNDDEKMLPGYSKITCHLVFDVKFDLRRKARYVAGGHLAPKVSKFLTYSSVVSRESVRIAFTIAALNDLDVIMGDVSHAYLHAKTKEKAWFLAGPEFGPKAGKQVLVVRALYGLPGSGNAWRAQLADTLRNHLGYKSTLADPDVWMKQETKLNGEKYYAYILVYVDDLLIIHEDPYKDMAKIKNHYPVTEKSIGPPKVYLGANIQQLKSNTTNKECWGASAEQYVREAVKNVKERVKRDGFHFNKKLSDPNYSPQSPFSNLKYRPELDTTEECNTSQLSFFQNLIGVLRWIVELGRIDINYEVSVLSQYLCSPRLGHLQQALHIFKYLDIHRENFISFDPTPLNIEEPVNKFDSPEARASQMKEYYPDAIDHIPPNAPEPLGKPIQINCFVDSDHAGNAVTRRSHTGILIFLNMAPTSWYSKRQNTVESSTYSSEFIALKTATEQIIALRYKLRMMGIPLEGAARVFCDNEAVYKNASDPTSTLKKKHQSIAYHIARQSVAANIIIVYKEDGETNLADILTKGTLSRDRRIFLRSCIMTNIKVDLIPDS